MAEPVKRGSVFNAHSTPFLPYDLEGPEQPEMSWLPVSFDRERGQGCYLMRMMPGAVTIAHDHPGMEEFLILDGDLVDSDGSVFGPGDFVSYEAGTTTTRGRRLVACSPSSSGGRNRKGEARLVRRPRGNEKGRRRPPPLSR